MHHTYNMKNLSLGIFKYESSQYQCEEDGAVCSDKLQEHQAKASAGHVCFDMDVAASLARGPTGEGVTVAH
eukprot:6958753-Ditylum_brightwellii.AAC.1